MKRSPWPAVVEKLPTAGTLAVIGWFITMNAGFVSMEMLDEGSPADLLALNVGYFGYVLLAWGLFTPLMTLLRELTSENQAKPSLEED